MLSIPSRILLCIFIIFSLSACTLNRVGIGGGGAAAQWNVEPALFCPGDTVTVSWDMSRIPRSHENCRPSNGGLATLTSCTSSSMCPAATDGMEAVCLDNHCCSQAIFESNSLECPIANGCYPDFAVTITANNEELEPPVREETRRVTGSRTLTPEETTQLHFTGFYNPPMVLFEDRKTATMVTPVPPTNITAPFPFTCFGTTPGWASANFNDGTTSSENVRVAGVRNTSRNFIILGSSEPAREPVMLAPGETSAAFNGQLNGVWTASLDARRDPAALNRPRCEATNVQNPWPDLEVEILLQCAAE